MEGNSAEQGRVHYFYKARLGLAAIEKRLSALAFENRDHRFWAHWRSWAEQVAGPLCEIVPRGMNATHSGDDETS